MKRAILSLLAGVAILGLPTVTAAASPSVESIPIDVDPAVLHRTMVGPVVAEGSLRDAQGRGARGYIAIVAWPGQTFNRSLKIGSIVTTPTVGWAATAADGSYAVRVSPSLVPADYIEGGGLVQFEAIGWTARSQGRWAFPATIAEGGTSSVKTRVAGASGIVTVNVPLRQPIQSRAALRTTLAHGAPQPAIPGICGWALQSTYDAFTVIGESWPYGAHKSWMKHSASHGMTVGAAASVGGSSWSASGTSSTDAGVTFTWAKSVAYRDYRVQERYGKYRQLCAGKYSNNYWAHVQYATGGYQAVNRTGYPSWSNCAPIPAGEWTRSSSQGQHYSLGGGVRISGFLNIDLSVDTNYGTTRELHYEVASPAQVCGDNDVPSRASKVKTAA